MVRLERIVPGMRLAGVIGDQSVEEVATKKDPLPVTPPTVDPNGGRMKPAERARSKRFFAHVDVDTERADLEVACIMDGLLVELTREKDSTVRVSIEIEGKAQERRYLPVESVTANARDLKLDQRQWEFEAEQLMTITAIPRRRAGADQVNAQRER